MAARVGCSQHGETVSIIPLDFLILLDYSLLGAGGSSLERSPAA